MPTFQLDGKEIPFEQGDTIIKAAYRQGIEIPHYCWHPGLSAPANCRMCLVEIKPAAGQRAVMLDIVEWDAALGDYRPRQKPKLLPACQMQAVEGQEVVSELSAHVKEARSAVQELLLLNHPVDCPICDQAGECKLQDYWLEHQATQKRMRDEPVHKPKAVSFGDTIVYDGERCVMCTRCVRFMEEVAKDPVLEMRERGNLNEIAVAPGRKLEGNYTFMTEHVCPVGALTTKDFRFKARVWFLKSAKSVCQGCATGCNAWLDYDPRYGKVQRYRPRDNEAVNKFWMCDEGMLSYRRAHEGRVVEAKAKGQTVTVEAAAEAAGKALATAQGDLLAVVLSARYSLEDNLALLDLARAAGTSSVYWSGGAMGKGDDVLMHPDKNPNTKGVEHLAPQAKPFRRLVEDIRGGKVSAAITLGGAAPSDDPEDATALGMLSAHVALTAHEGPLSKPASIVLPAASWAEATGTYVNAKAMKQVSEKAIEPQGASRPAFQLVLLVARAMGHDLGFTRLRELTARLKSSSLPPPAPAQTPATTPST